MVSTKKERSLVVIELNGGNDALNTIVPFNNGLYYDYRPGIGIAQQDVLPINEEYGFNPNMPAVKDLWDRGELAIINGIGYPQPNRSHFRSRDIWYTAEPDAIGTEGWLGAAIRDLDAKGENVLTGVNFGRGLPRALVCKGVPVASVGNLETYGLLPDIDDENVRHHALDALGRMYGPAGGRDMVAQALSENGSQALMGRRHPAHRAGAVFLQRGVCRHAHITGPEERRPSDERGPWRPHPLCAARQLRHPQRRAAGPRQAVAGRFHSHRRLHRRPEGAGPVGGHAGAGVVRVRAPGAGQRHRLRPRLPAAWPSCSAARCRADSSVSTRRCGRPTCRKATWPTPPISGPPTPPYSTAGWDPGP